MKGRGGSGVWWGFLGSNAILVLLFLRQTCEEGGKSLTDAGTTDQEQGESPKISAGDIAQLPSSLRPVGLSPFPSMNQRFSSEVTKGELCDFSHQSILLRSCALHS